MALDMQRRDKYTQSARRSDDIYVTIENSFRTSMCRIHCSIGDAENARPDNARPENDGSGSVT